jgi:hypothetical protein
MVFSLSNALSKLKLLLPKFSKPLRHLKAIASFKGNQGKSAVETAPTNNRIKKDNQLPVQGLRIQGYRQGICGQRPEDDVERVEEVSGKGPDLGLYTSEDGGKEQGDDD